MDERTGARSEQPRVAVLGTGIMGAGMAECLLDKGFRVDVWDRTPAVTAGLVDRGARGHSTPSEAAAGAGVVVTMLPTGDVTADVMLGQDALGAMPKGAVWAQMGTIGVAATELLLAEVASRRPDVHFVDAPVTGTRDPARHGQLTILASGPEPARSMVQPVFEALGQRVLWLGKAGLGTRLKLVLNTWLAFEIEAAAEARAAAVSLGVPYEALLAAVEGGPLASATALARLAKMERADDSPQFPLVWALKDLELTSEATGPEAVPVAAAISARWRRLVEEGFGRLDVSAARLGLADGEPARTGG